MPISITCPGCQRKLAVPDNAAGKSVKCPKCETLTRVPAQEPAEAATAVLEPEPEAALAGVKRVAHPVHHDETEVRPVRKRHLDDDDAIEELEEAPRRRPRAAEEDDFEEDQARERAQKHKKPVTTANVILGIVSAFITLLAFGAAGGACWLWTRLFDHKIERETGELWVQICVYSSCGLALFGFFTSLYSRGILRILALAFAILSFGAAAFVMLTLTGLINNVFEDYSKGRKASGSVGDDGFREGATYYVKGPAKTVMAFVSVDAIDEMLQMQRGGGPGGDRGGRGGGPGGGRDGGGPGGGPGGGGRGGDPGGRGGDPGGRGGNPMEMMKKISDMKAQGKIIDLDVGTEVKLVKNDTRPSIEIQEGKYKDKTFVLLSKDNLSETKEKKE